MSIVLQDPTVTINGTSDDISADLRSVTINPTRTDHDDTTFGAEGKSHRAGFMDGSVALEFVDDFASGEIDSILWTIFAAGGNVEMRVRADSGAISAANPEWRFQVCPTQYSAGGGVDTLAAKSITWPISGGITRVTS